MIPATAAVMAMEEDIWATVSRFLQKRDPPMIFCGTTMTSPDPGESRERWPHTTRRIVFQ